MPAIEEELNIVGLSDRRPSALFSVSIIYEVADSQDSIEALLYIQHTAQPDCPGCQIITPYHQMNTKLMLHRAPSCPIVPHSMSGRLTAEILGVDLSNPGKHQKRRSTELLGETAFQAPLFLLFLSLSHPAGHPWACPRASSIGQSHSTTVARK